MTGWVNFEDSLLNRFTLLGNVGLFLREVLMIKIEDKENFVAKN